MYVILWYWLQLTFLTGIPKTPKTRSRAGSKVTRGGGDDMRSHVSRVTNKTPRDGERNRVPSSPHECPRRDQHMESHVSDLQASEDISCTLQGTLSVAL